MRAVVVCRFGPFELDPASGQLFQGEQRVHLSAPQSAILTYLVCHPGVLISKETLINIGWGGAAVSDDNLKQVILRLRRILGDGHSTTTYIETVGHQGYRFAAPVQQAPREIAGPLDAQLAPFRALMQGQVAIDSLDLDQIRLTQREQEDILRAEPGYAAAHTRLAMACGLAFDATTLDATQDMASLERGIHHAHKGCELDPASGEAWSTLAFLLYLHGDAEDAAAAACKAMMLEPENGRHALCAGRVTWGGERLRFAARALTMGAGTALPRWLRTTVFTARRMFPEAFEEVRLGCAAQDAQIRGVGFPAVGLHLQHGMLLAADGKLDEGVAALQRELAWANSGQVYARESAANTHYTLGAIYARQQKRTEAARAFTDALIIAPGHIPAAAALRGEVPTLTARGASHGGDSLHEVDVACGHAIVLVRGNRHADAARVVYDSLVHAKPGCAGWLLPVEPMINPLARMDVWAEVLALIRLRAR